MSWQSDGQTRPSFLTGQIDSHDSPEPQMRAVSNVMAFVSPTQADWPKGVASYLPLPIEGGPLGPTRKGKPSGAPRWPDLRRPFGGQTVTFSKRR